MSVPKKIECVIFDMDGVITNTMPDHFKAWRKIFQELGINVSRHDIYSREGQKGLVSVEEITAADGRQISRAQALKILRQKEDLFKTLTRIRFISGSRAFLRALKRKNIQLGLVTGTSRPELLKILPQNIRKLFHVVVTGSDVVHGKPHPEPYLRALKSLKCPAKDAIVIENAPFGIRSAKRAGICCFAVTTSLPETYLREADDIFPTIKSLRHSMELLLNGKHRAP